MLKKIFLILFVVICFSFGSFSQKDWIKISEPGINVFISSFSTAYYFKNEKVGSHGSKYTLYKSTNGMQNFSMVKTKTGDFGCYSLDNMFFVDEDTGVIVELCQGLTDLLKTENGGQSWSDMGAGGTYGMALFFRSAQLGYYTFKPSGYSYLFIYQSGSSSNIMETTDYDFDEDTRMFFVNDSTGFIICKNFMENAIILKIENYGASWSQSYFLPMKTEFRDIIFTDENTGYVVGTDAIILKTEDQGDSWFNTATIPLGDWNSIDHSEGILHVVGDHGQYIKSNDAGQTWSSHPLGPATNLIYTRFFLGEHGYILNENGELFTNFPFPGIVEKEVEYDITVFPNPVEGILNVKPGNFQDDYEISIIDLTGKIVFQDENCQELDVSNLREGIYFVKLSVPGKSVVKKFVKK